MNEQQTLDFPFELETKALTEAGTFKGFASTFGGVPDAVGDIVERGAFADTIASGGKHGSGIAMLYQHRASKPIGVWTRMEENDRGLAVEGQLAIKASVGADAYELLRMGALKGLSIGYDVRDSERDDKRKIRKLKKLDLWEVSLVTFPANSRARITSVKAIEDARTERELEAALREAGLSKAAAQYVVRLARPSLREAAEASGVTAGITAAGAEDDELMRAVLTGLRQVNAGIGVYRRLYA